MSEVRKCPTCKKVVPIIRKKRPELKDFPFDWVCSACGTPIELEIGFEAMWAMEDRYKKRCSEAAKKAHETMRLNFKNKHKLLDTFMKKE